MITFYGISLAKLAGGLVC